MIKVYGYLRVSSQGQVDRGGFKRQEEAIKSYTDKEGFEIVNFFKEEGISGTKDETARPAFQEMMTEILSNGVRTIIVEGLDRLSRELRIQESLLVYLAAKGISLHSARTEQDVTLEVKADPMKKALIQIQGVFAELEKNQLVRRLKKGREKVKAETGRCEGKRPYGLTDQEREVVRRIKSMRRTRKGGVPGLTLRKIADQLNSESILTKQGAQWTATQVSRVLNRKIA